MGEQTEEPGEEYWPGGQADGQEAEAPGPPKHPAETGLQEVALPSEYLPAGHWLGQEEEDPGRAAWQPADTGLQAAAFDPLYCPGGHSEQEACRLELNCPAGQEEQAVDPEGAKEPAPQVCGHGLEDPLSFPAHPAQSE